MPISEYACCSSVCTDEIAQNNICHKRNTYNHHEMPRVAAIAEWLRSVGRHSYAIKVTDMEERKCGILVGGVASGVLHGDRGSVLG